MPRLAPLAPLLALALSACNPARGVPMFLFHSVGEGSPGDRYDVPLEEFDRALELIERAGAKTVSLDQVLDAAAGGAPLPERSVVLTFDDGRASLQSAQPALLKRGMSAEVFVVTDWLADDQARRHVVEDEAGRHPYLTWPELRQMVSSGAFRAQSHSRSHRRVRELPLADLSPELSGSRATITARLGVPVNFFAYPYGASSLAAAAEVERAGYRGAVAVQHGWGTRYAMRRRSVWRDCEYVIVEELEAAFGAPPR